MPRTAPLRPYAVRALVLMFLLGLAGFPAMAQRPTLVSFKNADVTSGSGTSENYTVSGDGRFVAFQSSAFDLSPLDDSNGRPDVFVRDLQTGVTILVSINVAGTGPGNAKSINPVISADGRLVAFESDASNLVPNDTNGTSDVFLRDLQAGVTTLVSAVGPAAGNNTSSDPAMSADGSVVVFKSFASNLVPNDGNGSVDVFARDLRTATTVLVSMNGAGTGSGNNASFPETLGLNKFFREIISDDGRLVVFTSYASDLVSVNDANGSSPDVFVRDLQTQTTTLVSINKTGTGSGDVGSTVPVISGDGRFVVFQSSATNMVAGDAVGGLDLFVRDLQTGVTSLVSVTRDGAGSNDHGNNSYFQSVSRDGRYVAFVSPHANLVADDTNNSDDVFVRDLQTNTTRLASVKGAGTSSGNGPSADPSLSADGRFLAFRTWATDLVAASDANGVGDVYVRDLQAETTNLLSVNSAGTAAADRGAYYPVISANGRFVVFNSAARDLVVNTIRSGDQVFASAVNGQAQFTATSHTVDETAGTATVSVTRAAGGSGPLTVNYAAGNGTASAPADFAATSGSLTFADGETTRSFEVPIVDDLTDEHDELLTITVSDFSAAHAAGSLSLAVLNITDDDPPPAVSINDVVVTEGDAGTVTAVFSLSLSAASGKTISVDLSATGGTAESGDFGFEFTRAFISPGATTQDIWVTVVGDRTFEPDETFTLNLSNPTNVTIADGQGAGTIKNDDPVPAISISNASKQEGDTATSGANFVVSLSNRSYQPITVNFATADGTAAADGDYLASSGALTFNPGESFRTVTVLVVGDTVKEGNETFTVDLDTPVGATLADAQGTGTITDDDSLALRFSAASYAAAEGAPAVAITVNRTGDATAAVTVEYATADGTASERGDYTTALGTLRFAAGETSKTFEVLLTDDGLAEGNETVNLTLSGATGNATLGVPSSAVLTLNDNDAAPSPTNPIAGAEFFVRQHYHDFLNREPDASGLAFWSNQITECETRPASERQGCREVRRINVSAAFFQSIEFQETGYLAYRTYGAAFGTTRVGGVVPLTLAEFLYDTQEVSRGVVIGQPGAEALLEANKVAYFDHFVARPQFLAAYPESMSAQDYVNTLANNTGDLLSNNERDVLTIRLIQGEITRAQALRAVAENSLFRNNETRRAFVLMQYFGYLRRNPNDAPELNLDFGGYNFWLTKLNNHNGNFVSAEMVKGFITSGEYVERFGP